MVGAWSARARSPALNLFDPVEYTQATLVETYPGASMLSMSGRLADLRPVMIPGYGVLLYDDLGQLRFNGFLTSVERTGAGTANVIFAGDDARMWQRLVWPSPTLAWNAQSAAYDVRSGPAETRLLGYIAANMGSTAFNSGSDDRRVPSLRVPATQARGPSATTSARFNVLGDLVSTLSVSGGLRTTIVQTYEGTTPYLDVKVTATPDYAAWARFGDSNSGAGGVLGEDWRYKLDIPTSTVVLCAAGGTGAARILRSTSDADRQALWMHRIEQFVDQRQTTEASEITQAMNDALAQSVGLTEVSAPLGASDLNVGGTGGTADVDVPLGAWVTVVLDGEVVKDRVRQITTTISSSQGQATVAVEPVIGSPDAGIVTPTQRRLAAALARISSVERNQ